MARPRSRPITLPTFPGDAGATGPAQPRRRVAVVDDPRRDPRTGARLGGTVKVMRRTGPAAIAAMPPALQDAAALYAETFEAVQAGGAVAAWEDHPTAAPAPSGAAPCRQFRALAQVERLRRLEAAVGTGAEAFGRGKAPAAVVPHLAAVRALAVDGASVASVLEAHGVQRTGARDRRLRAAAFHALARIAAAAGLLPEETAGGVKWALEVGRGHKR